VRSRQRVVDEMLVLAAQARQVEAFEQLAVRWHPRLVRHARRLTGDPEGAQEVAQDAWIAVARGLYRLQDPARFGSWALRIVTRRAADWIGRRQRTRQRSAALDAASQVQAPLEAPTDDRARVREALGRLAAGERALLAMFYVEDLTVAEIAEVLDVPAGTIKSRLFHARERLRAALEVHDGAEAQHRRTDS